MALCADKLTGIDGQGGVCARLNLPFFHPSHDYQIQYLSPFRQVSF